MKAGISQTPWDCAEIYTIASGDDCVMFLDPKHADALEKAILSLTTRSTKA